MIVAIDSSFNCDSSTLDGALVIKQDADCVFGKAIVSLIESTPSKIMVRRSIPKAMPPWGGQPYERASKKKPNF